MMFQIQFGKGGEGGKNREQKLRNKGFHSGIHFAATRTATQNKWEESRKEARNHISILKSFIVLQKSSYYLTRNKDKWQIFYITNARPAHTMALFLHGVEQQITFAFGLLAQTFLHKSEVLVFRSAGIWG